MGTGARDPIVEGHIRDLEGSLYQAMIKRDFAALDSLLADDGVYVHSTAVAESKAEYVAGVKEGLYEYHRIASREVKVRRYGDVAVVDGIVEMSVSARGGVRERIQLLFVLIWAKQAGTWRLVHRHATRMPIR